MVTPRGVGLESNGIGALLPKRDIIVVGGSAGGVEAVMEIVRGLPRNLRAAVFVVVHLSATNPSLLADILDRQGSLTAIQPQDGEPIKAGRIYVAPPDHHMLISGDRIRITRGPRHNLHRPAIDPLFRSAAHHFGTRVIGVVLTGFLDDGAAGLTAIKNAGGIAIVQDPVDAAVPSMPLSALRQAAPDYCVKLADIPELLSSLTESTQQGTADMATKKKLKVELAEGETKREIMPFTCPDCHGTIWEVLDDGGAHYECRVGHAYSPESMLEANRDSVERALWAAIRSLEESASLGRRLADNAKRGKRDKAAKLYAHRAGEREMHAKQLRQLLVPPEEKVNGGVKSQMKDDERQAS